MNPELFDRVGLVCPTCRIRHRPEDPRCRIVLGAIFERCGDDVVQGLLRCSCQDCRTCYPIVDGVPIVVKDLERWWQHQRSHVRSRPQLADELCDLFALLDRRVRHQQEDYQALNLYLDAHYGRPQPPVPMPWLAELQDRYWTAVKGMLAGDERPGGMALDLGCAVGRFTAELGRVSDLAVGIDIQFPFVQRAAMLHKTGSCPIDRQADRGRGHPETIAVEPSDNLLFMVADALDPPFGADAFDRVAALNLLDNVAYPSVLLGQMDALLKSGGEMILSSPYDWQAAFTDPGEWLADPTLTPAEVVKAILSGQWGPGLGLNHAIVGEIGELPWVLRRHDRHWAVFLVHLLRSRKRTTVGDNGR